MPGVDGGGHCDALGAGADGVGGVFDVRAGYDGGGGGGVGLVEEEGGADAEEGVRACGMLALLAGKKKKAA